MSKTSHLPPTSTAERTRTIVQIMSNKGRAGTSHDPLPDAADVIAVVMRWVARRGRRLDALPRHTRLQLDRLCDAGDPAALLVCDWIACRLPGPIAEALARADQNADEMMDEGRV